MIWNNLHEFCCQFVERTLRIFSTWIEISHLIQAKAIGCFPLCMIPLSILMKRRRCSNKICNDHRQDFSISIRQQQKQPLLYWIAFISELCVLNMTYRFASLKFHFINEYLDNKLVSLRRNWLAYKWMETVCLFVFFSLSFRLYFFQTFHYP